MVLVVVVLMSVQIHSAFSSMNVNHPKGLLSGHVALARHSTHENISSFSTRHLFPSPSLVNTMQIDPLLTPTGKKLQEGTRAVARQLTTDIIPKALERPASSMSSSSSSSSAASTPPKASELLELVPKIGSRVLNALGNQARKNLEDLQGDLADPSRIPQRLTQQTEELAKEARNVFLETPEGLQEPAYSVVTTEDDYEIRDYEGYTVASTTMSSVGERYSLDDVASGGAAFNALAAYLFGANAEGQAMEMTTPVTTTSLGEMRFFLQRDGSTTVSTFPAPLKDDNLYDTGSIQLVDIPPARLAVRRFTGFVTEGEVKRQKQVLLEALGVDGWELDNVKHGAVVPHMVFQYNPPYTLPMIRRNEIAVPVAVEGLESDVSAEWGASGVYEDDGEEEEDDVSPSDY